MLNLKKQKFFYDALRPLMKMIYSAEDTVTFKIKTGEMLIFNNHRLLHGRKVFDSSLVRHVKLVHVNLDEFHSKLRVSLRWSNNSEERMRLGLGETAYIYRKRIDKKISNDFKNKKTSG